MVLLLQPRLHLLLLFQLKFMFTSLKLMLSPSLALLLLPSQLLDLALPSVR